MKYSTIQFFLACILLTTLVTAGSFVYTATNDNLEINEELGDVLQAVTSAQLAELKSGTVKTKEGSSKFNQYLRFSDSSTTIASPSVLLDKSDEDVVDEFLKIAEGTAVTNAFFEYHLEFEEGLESKIKDETLSGLDGSKVAIFDQEFIIVEGRVEGKRVTLMFASGAVEDFLRTEEKKEYTIEGKRYELSIKTIETSTKSVVFTLNGQDLQKLVKTETIDIGNGLTLGVTDVLTSSGGNDLVEFFIGANIIEFEDTSYEDDSFNKGVKINKEKIEEAFVKVSATLVNDVLKISDIKYRAISKVDIHAKQGEAISKYIRDPQLLLGNWDLTFDSLSNTATATISFTPSGGDDEYTLTFHNIDGKQMSIPLMSNKNSFKMGDSDQDLVYIEGTSQTNYVVDVNDYFVLTTSNDKSGKTYIAKYESIDTVTNTLEFTDLTSGSKSVQYTNGTTGILGEGTLTIGSVTAKVYIEDAAGNSLAIDMNGDGDVASDEMNIVVEGGGILDLGSSNTLGGTSQAVTLTTSSSLFEETATDETITITIDTTLGTPIGIQSTLAGLTTHQSNTGDILGLTNYGALFTLDDETGKADTLTIAYPTKQVFATVTLSASAGSSGGLSSTVREIEVTTCSNGKQDGDETGIDCGGSCSNECASCSDEKQNQGEEGVDCGGPCPNACAPTEISTECSGCLQTLESGQKQCLQVGDVVSQRYCAVDQVIKAQKRNGDVCEADYECLTTTCLDGSCGKKITVTQIIVNAVILLVVIAILWYGYVLLMKD